MVVQAGAAAAALTEEKPRNLVSHRICSLVLVFRGNLRVDEESSKFGAAGEKTPVVATFYSSRNWLLAKKNGTKIAN